jgi:signal transduction histidine kinase
VAIIQGYSELLLQEATIKESAYLKELLTSLHSGTQRHYQVVNNMLDVAKIDSQSLKLYPESLSLSVLVRSVVWSFEQALQERNLTLWVEGLEELPDLEADVEALLKVVTCLLSNAIKYTPDGGTITVEGHYLAAGPQGRQGIQLTICDTGIGIDPAVQALIFTKFYRAEALNLHSTGQTKFKGAGPGLGLTIAYGLTRLHGGRLWVESPGRDENTCPGSQFHLVLPLRQGKG